MILGFSVSGSIAAVHTGDMGLNPTWSKKKFWHALVKSNKQWTSRYQSIDGL